MSDGYLARWSGCHLENRAPDFDAILLPVAVGHLQAGPDQSLNLVAIEAEDGATRTNVLPFIYNIKKLHAFKM